MRKILYSPGWGAGWSTWNSGEVGKYMLTYQPIIDFLEAGGKFTEAHAHGEPHPILDQLQKECAERFGESYVCLLGADDLKVATVKGRVRIHEYDGSESYEEEGEYRGWV